MALTMTRIGLVDPTAAQFAGTGQPLDLQLWAVDLVLGATTDYGANGIDLTSAVIIGAAGINVSQIVQVLNAEVRPTAGGTPRGLTPEFDATNRTLRLFKSGQGVLSAVSTAAMAAGNGAGVETFIRTAAFSLPANTLSANGMAVRVTASGLSTAGIDATKAIKVRLGGVAGFDVTAGVTSTVLTTSVITHWSITATIIRTGAATQDAWFNWVANNATGATPQTETGFTTGGTQDFTTALTLGTTVNATGANVMIGKTELIELLPAAGTGAALIEITAAADLVAGDIVRMTLVAV